MVLINDGRCDSSEEDLDEMQKGQADENSEEYHTPYRMVVGLQVEGRFTRRHHCWNHRGSDAYSSRYERLQRGIFIFNTNENNKFTLRYEWTDARCREMSVYPENLKSYVKKIRSTVFGSSALSRVWVSYYQSWVSMI